MIKRIRNYKIVLLFWFIIPFILRVFGVYMKDGVFIWGLCAMFGNFVIIMIENVKSRKYFFNNYPKIYEQFLSVECFDFKRIFSRKKVLRSILEETKDDDLIRGLVYLKKYVFASFFLIALFMFLYVLTI